MSHLPTRAWPALLAIGFALSSAPVLIAQGAAPRQAAGSTAAGGGIFEGTRPEGGDPETQLDQGARYYWGACMPCHGDLGQGLSPEWRARFQQDERGCWEPGCHGADHLEETFYLDPEAPPPALAGPASLARFENAQQLYDYVAQAMPLGVPGSIPPRSAWAVSAYVLDLHGTAPAGLPVEGANASAIPVDRRVTPPESAMPGVLALAGLLGLTALVMRRRVRAAPPATHPSGSRPAFVGHLHPPTIPAAQARLGHTLGAGGLAVFLCLVLLVTGMLEMYYYVPTPELAAASVQTIAALVPYGSLVRNLHFWSAQALVVVMTIHLLRVVLTGANAPPRRLNYLIGLGLLVLVLLLDFTGYVLRWDEGIRWALVVGANLLKTIPAAGEQVYRFVLGGDEPGPAALTRFYAWHVFGLTLAGIFLGIWHAFRVRRDGGIAAPAPGARPNRQRITRLALLQREGLAMLLATVALLLVSASLDAPLDRPLAAGVIAGADARAPWFFLWVQQLLQWGDPFALGVLAPVLVVVALGLLPYLLRNAGPEELGTWFPRGNRLAQAAALALMIAILALTITGAVQ